MPVIKMRLLARNPMLFLCKRLVIKCGHYNLMPACSGFIKSAAGFPAKRGGRLTSLALVQNCPDETTDTTTDETTSHSAMPPINSGQAAGYSHLTDKATSHSTRSPADELLAGHPKGFAWPSDLVG